MYEVGEGTETNLERAMYYYEKAAEAGHIPSQLRLGTLYQQDHAGYQWGKVVHYLNLAAEQGSGEAACELGILHMTGKIKSEGTAKDRMQHALEQLDRAVQLGEAKAYLYLANIYEEGLGGTDKDSQKAARYRRLASTKEMSRRIFES